MKLIDKDALVAEIEKRSKEAYGNEWGWAVKCETYSEILSFLDTLEVKEVEEEPVSEEWIEELRTKLDSMSKEDFKKVFDKYAVDFNEEPVSEELEEAAIEYCKSTLVGSHYIKKNAFKAGAKWQIAKLIKDATEVTIHIEAGNYPYIPQLELYDYDKDVPLAKKGDKYKVVLIKED